LSLAGHAFINKAVQQLLKKPQPLTLGSFEEFAPILEKEPPPRDIKSLMIVPLIAHGRLSGALAVYDKRPNTFGDDEGRLLTIVAAQVASALENSKLFTDLQRHARNMEETLAELQEFSRLQNEFVQNVSHELRTPLTFVKAYVDLILEETLGNISDSIRDSLEIVARRTQDLNRLVSDIITHQQLQMGVLHFEEVDLAEVIRLVIDSAGPIAEQNELLLSVRLPEDLPRIQADPNRLGQVLDNLVGNAVKFTGPGGEITVSAIIEDQAIRIEVADTGIGITKSELNKIFNRFYQVDGSTTRRFSGTGLGLTIVKQIIEAHQGQVSVESEPGRGSTFSFTLPLRPQLEGETDSRFDL
jgi:signal transduction histidine kinase